MKKLEDKRKVPVLCETTGMTFGTIQEASAYAKANPWTMSIKMDVMGQFIDSEGRVYKRLTPMKTKNVYTTPSASMIKSVIHSYKRTNTKEEPMEEQQQELPLKSCPEFVKQAVADKIKDELKATPIWKHICEIMEYLGINEFTIKKD